MGFSAYTVQPRVTANVGTGIGATLKKNKGAKATLSFSVSMPVAAKLGWADGDKLEVMLGEGEHHGMVRLRKNNSAAGSAEVKKRGTDTRTYMFISMGHLPAYIDRAETKRWCQHNQVDPGGWTEIRLPSWSGETRAGAGKASAPAPRPAGSALPAPRTTEVTSKIMGDPDPNRSALALRTPAKETGLTRGQLRELAEQREAPEFNAADEARRRKQDLKFQERAALQQLFGLTIQEATILYCLMDGRVWEKEKLHAAAYEDDPTGGAEIKIIDVFVHKVRKKLQTRLIEIDTIWGTGYQMKKDSVERAKQLQQGLQVAS